MEASPLGPNQPTNHPVRGPSRDPAREIFTGIMRMMVREMTAYATYCQVISGRSVAMNMPKMKKTPRMRSCPSASAKSITFLPSALST